MGEERMNLVKELMRRVWDDPKTFCLPIYVLSSFFLLILNKLLVTRLYFDYPIVTLMFQTGGLLFAIELGRLMGLLKLGPYTLERGIQIMPASILHSLAMYTTISAFEGISLPSYGALKRQAPWVVLLLSRLILHRQLPSPRTAIPVLIVVIGSSLATTYEWSLDWFSAMYGIMHLSLLPYMVLFERLSVEKGYSALDIIYMNSFNNFVFFLIADMIQDEIRDGVMLAFFSNPKRTMRSISLLEIGGKTSSEEEE